MKSNKRTIIKIISGLVLAVGISWAAATPTPSGQNQAEILWDSWGVPHIYATNDTSLFKAFGWAQMHNHSKLLLHDYALARGKGAEFFGQDDLVSDRSVRLMGLYPIARQWYAQQTPRFRADLDAFAEGINLYGRNPKNGLDAASLKVLPVDGVDVMAHAIRIIWHFQRDLSHIKSGLSNGEWLGSNGWAIAPSHSADGHAMLLANPHLPWNGERTLFEAELNSPDYQCYGSAIVGIPILSIAFNESIGWTHTVNTINPCSLYQLTPDGKGYRFDGSHFNFSAHVEKIKVLQADGSLKSEDLLVRNAIQGPVIEDKGQLKAIRVAGLQCGSYSGAMEQWWKMGQARNLSEFQSALRLMQLPMFNTIYADSDGNIFLFDGGLVPKKGNGDFSFWTRPVSGDTKETVWADFMDYDSLPMALNPKAGWVQNSNSDPWYMTQPILDGHLYPPDMSDIHGSPSFREQRGIRMLTESEKISYDQLIADKFSTRSEMADHLVDDLVTAAKSRGGETLLRAADVLRKWDRCFEDDSRGAVLFEAWKNRDFVSGWPLSVPFDSAHFLETPRGFANPGRDAQILEDAAKETESKYARMDITWGEVHRFRRGKFDFPANGGSPNLGIFRSVWYDMDKDGKYLANGGDSYIEAIDFSKPLKASVLLAYGNSSDPVSPHYGDQLELDSKKELRPVWFYRQDAEAHTVEKSVIPGVE